MESFRCSHCGGNELLRLDDYALCAFCRTQYEDRPKELARQTVVNIRSDIETLLQKCKDDPANARRYAGLVLDIDPTNQNALRFLR